MTLLWLAGAAAMTFAVAEGLITGRVTALPVRFERTRQPISFWLITSIYTAIGIGFLIAGL